jgi:hypothetical protein
MKHFLKMLHIMVYFRYSTQEMVASPPPPKSYVITNKRILKTCGLWVHSNGIPFIRSFMKICQTSRRRDTNLAALTTSQKKETKCFSILSFNIEFHENWFCLSRNGTAKLLRVCIRLKRGDVASKVNSTN